MKEDILMTVRGLVADFLYYNRKEDEDLGINAIQTAIKEGIISEEEIVKEFAGCLSKGLSE